MIIDISQELFSCRIFPGDDPPTFNRVKSIGNGDAYDLTNISMCVHNGTHIDAPSHFIAGGGTVEQIGLSAFVGDCYVARRSGSLYAQDVIEIMENARAADAAKRILIAGDIVITADAARAFAQSGICLIGNESQTIGPPDAPAEVHRILLGAQIVILEGIVLTDAVEGRYFLSAAPLKLGGCEGSPCRAYLMR